MKHQAHISNKEQKEVTNNGEAFGTNLNQLNAKEINKLKSFLKTIQDGATSCSLAQQGKSPSFGSFSTSKTNRNNMWILDSGAIDHMTSNLHVFETYELLENY